MLPRLRHVALTLGLLGSLSLGIRDAAAKEKNGSTSSSTSSTNGTSGSSSSSSTSSTSDSSDKRDLITRAGYRPAPGAQILGEAVASASGDIAFFEQNGEVRELVVCLHGSAPGRWTVKADTTRLRIFWVGPTQIVLGTDVLAPKMIVRWQLARA